MRNAIRSLCVLGATTILSACTNDPVATGQTTNANVPVALLFEHEGCQVYRFHDGGRHHYYVRCKGGSQQTMGTQNCGKNCDRSASVQTHWDQSP